MGSNMQITFMHTSSKTVKDNSWFTHLPVHKDAVMQISSSAKVHKGPLRLSSTTV